MDTFYNEITIANINLSATCVSNQSQYTVNVANKGKRRVLCGFESSNIAHYNIRCNLEKSL